MTAVSPVVTIDRPTRQGPPLLVHVLCWVLSVAITACSYPVVVLVLSLSCLPSWHGCEDLAHATMLAYIIAGLLISTLPLVWALFMLGSRYVSRGARVLAVVITLLAPILTLGVCTLYYMSRYNLMH